MSIAKELSKEYITKRIQDFVAEKGAILLFASESGSRGWGFSSPDSDYDGRFIYMWPTESYLSPFQSKDTLRMTGEGEEKDLDFEGWSLSMVLKSLRQGNPVTLEWVQSPVVYYDLNLFGDKLFHAFGGPENFCPGSAIGHYKGMASKAMNESIKGSDGYTMIHRPKKLFYALRATLAAMYAREYVSMPPMDWESLVLHTGSKFSDELKKNLEWLMAEKVSHGEHHTVRWSTVEPVLEFLENAKFQPKIKAREQPAPDTYEAFFRKWVRL